MDVGTLLIAVAGVVLGGASLAWQIVAWRKSGPVVSVFVHEAPFFVRARDGEMAPRPDLGVTLTVNAVNTGRTAARIDSWGYALENGSTGAKYDLTFGEIPMLPCPLEPHQRCEFPFTRESLIEGMTPRKMLTARGFVQLATGKRVYAPNNSVTLSPGSA
jgi:hypothetical protein